ncbi:hypothetical protein GZ989_011120 (plasmid) [Campylobacter fetus]|uniref:Cpp19 n=2 Tax=Campylobacter TaxID=194 RepID=A0A9W5EU79_CAMHY|nr:MULTISPECIES: hypothetical protein [Campylobacter]KAA3684166.1 hypothetical protein E3U42_09955 [Campylobacter fetus subsp. fetus]MBC3779837.1 hypothetical protein [Campylobacter fetus subsp. fetus]MBC3782209.1 hypothetical protein [Campylobacter fetus subsp. venerealis]MBK3501323.1 hypothetical protein [Campylobacter fetus subsp. venerealis]MBK3503381.1 hypothetical protein [Campylobacter fetus subsp. venerealis]
MLQESKIILDLKREYQEKLKQAKIKEKQAREKLEKKLAIALISSLTQNENFKIEFTDLINKYEISNLQVAYNELNNFI